MLSAFTGFVIGFGGADLPELTDEVLNRINQFRNGEYVDQASAMEVHNSVEKKKFETAEEVQQIFLTKFQHGKDKGIEMCWGFLKKYYRRKFTTAQKKNEFAKCVNEALAATGA